MNSIYHEIEIKFKITQVKNIRKKIKKEGGIFISKTFERTVRFDTPAKKLEKNGLFLRTRTGFKNVITLKQKVDNKKFREREEIEFEISEPEKMKTILEKLGFTKIKIMEKYREKWELKNTEIVIDNLPMGNFIEIEGEEKDIKKVVKILELDFKNGIISTYWDLWNEFCKKEGIKNKNIVFNFNKK